MKLLLSLITTHCFLLFEVKGQSNSDLDLGMDKLRRLLGISDGVSLVHTASASNVIVPGKQFESVSDNRVVRYELTANSRPIYDAVVTAEFFSNGTYSDLWTSQGADIIVNDNGGPRISPGRALYTVAQSYNACHVIQYAQNKEVSLFYIKDPVTKVARLVYLTSFVHYGQVTGLRNETTETVKPTALVDANTGEVIQVWDGLAAQSVRPITINGFGGNVGEILRRTVYWELQVGLQQDGKCIYSTQDVQVQSMGSTTEGPFSPTSFDCNAPQKETYDNANGGYSPLNDAMMNAQKTIDMYRKYVNGLEQPHFEMPVKLRVHYGKAYSNAFWDGTHANFGDGSSSTSYPLVTLDTIAHEIGHAFTGYPKGSKLETVGEPGGINEAFSDMSGQAAVFYSCQSSKMTTGQEYAKSGVPVRYMCDPRSDKNSIDHYSQYKSDMDPHYSSGLYNKVFCLLSRRGGYWDIGTAFQVFAFANRLHWRSKTTFNEGVCGVQTVARKLLGPEAVDDVRKAFHQVGLACPS